MAQSRLASSNIAANTNEVVYTVPAGKSAVVSVFARNFGSSSAIVDLSHTQATLNADFSEAVLSIDTANYTTGSGSNAGFIENFNGTSLAYNNNGGDHYGSSNGSPFYKWQPRSTEYNQPYNSGWSTSQYLMNMSNGRNRFQISGFYSKGTYAVSNSNHWKRFLNDYPWTYDFVDTEQNGNNNADLNDNIWWNNNGSYNDSGFIGYKDFVAQSNSNGYITFHRDITQNSGNESNYTSTSNSGYWMQGNGYSSFSQGSNSLLPLSRLDSDNLYLFQGGTVYSSTYTTMFSGQCYTNGSWTWNNHNGNATNRSSDGLSGSDCNIMWFRPVGDYGYFCTQSNKVYRCLLGTGMQQGSNWVRVDNDTNVFPDPIMTQGVSYTNTIIEDEQGVGYWVTNDDNIITSRDFGETWEIGDFSSVTGITTTTDASSGPKEAGGAYKIYTADGAYDVLKAQRANIQDAFELDLSLGAKSHLEHRGLILNAGDKIYARSTNSDTVIDVYGFEE